MSRFSVDDQWRSFQTYVAAYLAGMMHPLDVFTISRAGGAAPPLVEFRYESGSVLQFAFGDACLAHCCVATLAQRHIFPDASDKFPVLLVADGWVEWVGKIVLEI